MLEKDCKVMESEFFQRNTERKIEKSCMILMCISYFGQTEEGM
jgi:hypothetical protein